MTLVVVGALPYEKVLKLAKQHFATPELQPLPPTYIPKEPPQLTPRNDHRTGDFKIVRGTMAFPIPEHTHQDTPALTVLADILGYGQSSLLWEELREKQHLVHSIYASAWSPSQPGLLSINYVCDPGKQEAVEQAILQTLDTLVNSHIDPKKVEKAVRQTMVGEINTRKTMTGQASQLGFCKVILGALDYPKVFINLLQAVTPQKLKEVQRHYLNHNKLSSLSLSPTPHADAPTTAITKAPPLPDFEEIRLKNGSKLLLQPYSKLPKVNIRAVFEGGPLFEAPHQRGITGILATLLTKDTHKRTAQQIAEAIESIGGSFSEFTGNNSLGLSLEVVPHDLDLAQEILHDAIMLPKFTEEHFIIERDAQIAAINEEMDEILDYGIRQLRGKFFNDHAYAIPPLGLIENLEKITLADVGLHKEKLLNANNMVVSLSGDFDRQAVLDKLVPLLEKLPGSDKFTKDFPKFKGPASGNYDIPLEKEQVVVLQAYPGVTAVDPLFDVSEVMDELLSGMSSNLFTHVREEKGMAYYVGGARMIGVYDGMFYFYAGTNNENYKNVFIEIEKEVKRLQNGQITEIELQRCKTRLKAAHRMGLQTPGARGMKAALDCLFGLPTNHWRNYDQRIDAVTIADLVNFAKEKFQDSQKVCMSVGHI